MRLIDADALILELQKSGEENPSRKPIADGFISILRENCPTIESPRDWTPCAEGLPEKVDFRLWSKNVLATVEQKTGKRYVIEAYYHYGHGEWKHDQDEDFVGEVIAWQPLPAPYRADDTTGKVKED